MTVEQIYCDIADDLVDKINSGEYLWDSICSSMELEFPDYGYGIVVWCHNSDVSGDYFIVSIRKTNGNKDMEDWNEIMCESTDAVDFEQLENVITRMMQKLHR